MSLIKPLSIIVLTLIVYQLVIEWIWHLVGVHGYHFWWLTGLVNLIGFPLLFLNIVYKQKPRETDGWWNFAAYMVCWTPLILSIIVGHVVRVHVSGYYHAMQISTMPGAMESIPVGQAIVVAQCLCLTILLWGYIAEKAGIYNRRRD